MLDSSGLRIRVDLKLRQEFLKACRDNDSSAAEVLRDFMRNYVTQSYQAAQGDLFDTEHTSRPTNDRS